MIQTGDLSWPLGSMETLLPLRDSWLSAKSPPPDILGIGIGVAAVWVIRGGVRLLFSSTWPLMGTTVCTTRRGKVQYAQHYN